MPLVVVDPRNNLTINPDHIISMQLVMVEDGAVTLKITTTVGTYAVTESGSSSEKPLDLDAVHKKLVMASMPSVTIDCDETLRKQLETPEGREMFAQLLANTSQPKVPGA